MADPAAAPAWLREQVLARLEMAREACDGDSGQWFMGRKWNVYRAEDEAACDLDCEGEENRLVVYGNVKPQSGHIAINDPRQIIADCESDLAILDEHYILTTSDRNEAYEDFSVLSIGGASRDHGCVTCHYYTMGGIKGFGICRTVKAVAAGYRHWPGYAEHWSGT